MSTKYIPFILLLTVLVLLSNAASLRFANSYGDHMVLQHGTQNLLWGRCGDLNRCNQVKATLSTTDVKDNILLIDTSIVQTSAPAGDWVVKLPAMDASHTPYVITVTDGAETVNISDVLFGDVWLCGGQSNMAFVLEAIFNASTYINESASYPLLRMFTSFKQTSDTPLDEQPQVEEEWAVSSPSAVVMDRIDSHSSDRSASGHMNASHRLGDDNWLYMSAVCYLYGVHLTQYTDQPVGLLNTNWGGSHVEEWMSPEAFEVCPDTPVWDQNQLKYNGMIRPLLNMTIKGVIWYQGESNVDDTISQIDQNRLPLMNYACSFPAMIADWRAKWHEGTQGATEAVFPFGFVQLPSYIDKLAVAQVRHGQMAGYHSVPNPALPGVFNAVAIDLTDLDSPYGSVHIRDKASVAARLAAASLNQVYNATEYYWGGPFVSSVELQPAAINIKGFSILVSFENVGEDGLDLRNTSLWEVCQLLPPATASLSENGNCSGVDLPIPEGSDWVPGQWLTARAVAMNSTSVSVTVDVDPAREGQLVVRYAWRALAWDYKQAGLYAKKEDYPAGPFVSTVSGNL